MKRSVSRPPPWLRIRPRCRTPERRNWRRAINLAERLPAASEDVFDEVQDAAEVVTVFCAGTDGAGGGAVAGGLSGDIAFLRRVSGDHQQRHAKSIDELRAAAVGLEVPDARGTDMIVQAAPVVPENKNYGVVPINRSVQGIAGAAGHALTNAIHDVGNPRWA